MGVFHGRGNVGMSHELLDGDEIDPQANQASGESMPKVVEAAAWNPGSPERAGESSLGVFQEPLRLPGSASIKASQTQSLCSLL